MDSNRNARWIMDSAAKDIAAALEDGRAYALDGRLFRDLGGLIICEGGGYPKFALHWDPENRMLRALPFGAARGGWILIPVDPETLEPGEDPAEVAVDEMRRTAGRIRHGLIPNFLARLERELDAAGRAAGLEN